MFVHVDEVIPTVRTWPTGGANLRFYQDPPTGPCPDCGRCRTCGQASTWAAPCATALSEEMIREAVRRGLADGTITIPASAVTDR